MILKLSFNLCRNCDGETNNQSKHLREWENERDSREKASPSSNNHDFTNSKSNPFYVFKALPSALDLMLTYARCSFLSLVPLYMSKKLKGVIQFRND